MQTRCPHCHTVFRVARAQLEAANGMVRCGFCKEIFDARIESDTVEIEPQPPRSDDAGQRAQPRREPAAKTSDRPPLISEADHQLWPDEPASASHPKPYSAAATTAWSLAILVLIAALLSEYLWFNQPEMLQHESLKPLTARLCQITDCERLQRRDPSKIEMISRNIYTHPNEKDALMVSTTIVNHATYAQPYPDVQIDFSDVRGELIASRRFTPGEYLPSDEMQASLLPSGTPLTFGLEIRDPGRQAITYEFSFH